MPRFPAKVERVIVSIPINGGKIVTNVYVELVDGNPKLRVEYEK